LITLGKGLLGFINNGLEAAAPIFYTIGWRGASQPLDVFGRMDMD